VGARSCREDIEDQLGAVHDAAADAVLDVLPLRRRQLVVEDDQRGVTIFDDVAQFLDLPLAEVRGRVGTIDLLCERADDSSARRIREPLQLGEVFLELMPRDAPLPLDRRADENDALDRGSEGDQFASDCRLLTRDAPNVTCRQGS
jgi:hypothetical protein